MSEFEYIYAIEHPHGFVKIGRAKQPFDRASGVQTGSPYELELRYVLKYLQSMFLPDPEPVLHNRFGEHNVRGEWFQVDPETVRDAFEELVEDEEQSGSYFVDLRERRENQPDWKTNLGRRVRL